jgi:hypothetical protein
MIGSRSIRQILSCSQAVNSAQRLIAFAAALMYLVVAAGVPLPVLKLAAKSGELFPCSDCPCGCDSAEHCWRSCCCHTLAERLAWAEENGVTPPDFALIAAREAGLDSGGRPLTEKVVRFALATPSCCARRHEHDCCKSATTKHSCCESLAAAPTNSRDLAAIVAWRALGCRGQSLHWLTAVPTLISVELNPSDQLPRVTWLGPHSSDIAAGVADVPTPPPPERA